MVSCSSSLLCMLSEGSSKQVHTCGPIAVLATGLKARENAEKVHNKSFCTCVLTQACTMEILSNVYNATCKPNRSEKQTLIMKHALPPTSDV